MKTMMLVILLITSLDNYNKDGSIEYKSVTWTDMTADQCWDTAAEINGNSYMYVGAQTAACLPIIHPKKFTDEEKSNW